MDTLPQLFAHGRSRRDPGSTLIEGTPVPTYGTAEFWTHVAKTIDTIDALDVRQGDRVLVQAEKSVPVLLVYLACVHTGAVFLPLNAAYTDAEVQWIIDDATPKLVLRDPSRTELPGPHRSMTLEANGGGTFGDLVALINADSRGPALLRENHLRADDLACLLYTSGTTGKPKGAMLTHGNLASNAQTLVEAWGFTEQDTVLHMLPIFHAHGLFVAANTMLACGGSLRWLPKFDIDEVLKVLPDCTVVMGVPTHYTRLLAAPSFYPQAKSVGKTKLFISGSAPLLATTHEEFEARTGHRILERYGMTETVMLTSNPLHGERRAGTVGPALPGVDVRVIDEDGKQTTPGANVVGDVEVRGPNVFSGYWNRPDLASTEFTADGYFKTGDVGMLEEGGYLRLIGRAKDLIISGGLNVYPIEVEELLDSLPGVLESAVIGVTDPDFGEAVIAVVVAQPAHILNSDALRKEAKKTLASFKVPKRIHVVDTLPRNAMGKVEKAKLRATYSE